MLVSDFKGMRAQSHKASSTSDTSHKDEVPRLSSFLSDLATQFEVLTTPLKFDNLLEWLI